MNSCDCSHPSNSAASLSLPLSVPPSLRSISHVLSPLSAALFHFRRNPISSRRLRRPSHRRRTVSDPNPAPDETPFVISRVNDSIKQEPPIGGFFVFFIFRTEVRRIRDRLKEMNQWWNEVLSEEENRDVGDEIDTDKKSGSCKEEDDEGTVGVERVGDSLELRLKCPYGKGFDILISGKSCFYKLI